MRHEQMVRIWSVLDESATYCEQQNQLESKSSQMTSGDIASIEAILEDFLAEDLLAESLNGFGGEQSERLRYCNR